MQIHKLILHFYILGIMYIVNYVRIVREHRFKPITLLFDQLDMNWNFTEKNWF